MKKLVLLVAALAFYSSADAQVVKVTQSIAEKLALVRLAGDSSHAAIPLGYTGTNPVIMPGQQPDSIYIQAFNNADTVGAFLNFKASVSGSGIYTSTRIDSLSSLTATVAQKVVKVPAQYFQGYDLINLAILGTTVGSANAASATYVTARLIFFYNPRAYRP